MLEINQKAPDFTLENQDGQEITLSSFLGQKVILYFYPKDNTSGCTKQACEFRDLYSDFQDSGTVVIGVSKDSVKSHVNFRSKYDLNFNLLSDPKCEVLKSYGAFGEKKMYGKTYMGTIRTTLIIDEEGKIRKIYPKVRVKGHVEKVLADLKDLG